MDPSGLLMASLLLPIGGAGLVSYARSTKSALQAMCAFTLVSCALAVGAAAIVFLDGPATFAGGWLHLDALSAYHFLVMALVFSLSAAHALGYFLGPQAAHPFPLQESRRFSALWLGALSAVILVLSSNELGLMWVAVESTTLLTAFLISAHVTRGSVEAMWKYLIITSVGIAFAFMGVLLFGAAAAPAGLTGSDSLLWTRLRDAAAALDPDLARWGFVFILVGYGTKVGLAPLHAWLPDAHSQAPSPVSALFSGFLLNAALYCIMRYLPLVEGATGRSGWAPFVLMVFGCVSIVIAAAFIVFQHDVKRLLAYHSVEHLGIITLGLGIGGLGVFAALFHTLNHSLCKISAFFCAGRIGQSYGTHDMRNISGALQQTPLFGAGLLASLLALIGVAPFALFMSELQLVKGAVDAGVWWALAIFLAGVGIVFVGALGHAISMAWGRPMLQTSPERASRLDAAVVALPLIILVILGVWMPEFLASAIAAAARIVTGGG